MDRIENHILLVLSAAAIALGVASHILNEPNAVVYALLGIVLLELKSIRDEVQNE